MRTIGEVNQIEALRRRRVANLVKPDLSSSFGMAPIAGSLACLLEVKASVCVPVEHDPLSDSNDALLRLIQSRELCFNGIIGKSHSEKFKSDRDNKFRIRCNQIGEERGRERGRERIRAK
jgi:hypothetical protein